MHALVSALGAVLVPKDNLLRTFLTSLQLVTGTVWRRYNVSLPFTIVYILFSCPLGSWVLLWKFETIKRVTDDSPADAGLDLDL